MLILSVLVSAFVVVFFVGGSGSGNVTDRIFLTSLLTLSMAWLIESISVFVVVKSLFSLSIVWVCANWRRPDLSSLSRLPMWWSISRSL